MVKILLIEDKRDIVDLYSHQCKLADLEIRVAKRGISGLKMMGVENRMLFYDNIE